MDDAPSLGMRQREKTDGLMRSTLVDVAMKSSLRAAQIIFPCVM